MKLCMMSYTMARRPDLFSLRGMLELAKELELEGIDFVTLHDTPAGELRRMAEEYGLTVAAHTFLADMNFPDVKDRQAGIDAVKRGVEAAVALGTTITMIPTLGKSEFSREQSRQHYIAGFQEVLDFATSAGVTLTVENFPGVTSPFVTSTDVMQIVREVPGVKITFDNGNCTTGGEDAGSSFARCAEHVVHAHYKDWHLAEPNSGLLGLDGRWYRGGLIGQGIVNQRGSLASMKEAGYQGFIDIEYEGTEYTPADATRRAAASLRELMAELVAV